MDRGGGEEESTSNAAWLRGRPDAGLPDARPWSSGGLGCGGGGARPWSGPSQPPRRPRPASPMRPPTRPWSGLPRRVDALRWSGIPSARTRSLGADSPAGGQAALDSPARGPTASTTPLALPCVPRSPPQRPDPRPIDARICAGPRPRPADARTPDAPRCYVYLPVNPVNGRPTLSTTTPVLLLLLLMVNSDNDHSTTIKRLPEPHTCGSVNKHEGRMANKDWIAAKGKEMLREEPSLGARAMQQRLEKEFNIKLGYNNVWKGRCRAMDELMGTYEAGFQLLWNFKAELLAANPGSVFEIDVKKVDRKVYFNQLFVAFKPCIDGFLAGCRPYVGIDSTFLTGRYTGQLAAAIAVDGHNWMFPVAFGIFDKENNANCEWFMRHLRNCIGEPNGLAIHTDACKGLENDVSLVFNKSEHRECMRHLMLNYTKKFKGDLVTNMWPASWTFEIEKHESLMAEIEAQCPPAITYLRREHKHLWTRSKFANTCKVEYVNNNLVESFNSWIRDHKQLPIVELVDKIREMVMSMREKRCIAEWLQGIILPSVLKELNHKSKCLHYSESRAAPLVGGISGNGWRHIVDLGKKECSCRQWMISGKPCTHALHFILSKRVKIESYVDDYFSVARFKAAYEGVLMPIRGKAQWPKVNTRFNMLPPKLNRSAGHPKTKRIRNSEEPKGPSRQHQCKRCGQFGHRQKGCREKEAEDVDETIPPPQPIKRKRPTKAQAAASTTPSEQETEVIPIPPRQPSKRKRLNNATTTALSTPTNQGTQSSISSQMTRWRTAAIASPSTPANQATQAATSSPITRQRAAVMSSPSTRTRSKILHNLLTRRSPS